MQIFKVDMSDWTIIIVLSLWLFFPQMTCAGAGPERSSDGLAGLFVKDTEPVRYSGIYFATNEEKKTSDDVTADGTVKADEDTAKPETITNNEKPPKTAEPLKPFAPSETIPADQGVDFPYDI